jgi:hypothetical protein
MPQPNPAANVISCNPPPAWFHQPVGNNILVLLCVAAALIGPLNQFTAAASLAWRLPWTD